MNRMYYFRRRLKNWFKHKFLLRLFEVLIIVTSLVSLIFFSWSLIEVLLEVLKISFPKPIVPQVVFWGIFLFLLIALFLGSISIIEEGDEGMLQRLGKFVRILRPGVHFIIPFWDSVVVDTLSEQLLDVDPQGAYTKDYVPIMVDFVVFWRIVDLKRAYYDLSDLEASLENLVTDKVLSEIAQVDLREALLSKSRISQAVLNAVDEVTSSWGIKIIRVLIQDIILLQSTRDSLEAEKYPESFKRAGIVETEGKKQAALLGKQQDQELIDPVEKRIEKERANFNFNFNLSQRADMKAQAESKAMNDSTDNSQTVTIGGNGNVTGSTINLGTISGAVTNAINQLPPESSISEQPSLRELLPQLQQAIEEDKELSIEDKADLLEQVKVLTEAKHIAEPEKREGLIRKARKVFAATINSLPDTAKIVEACSKLLPLILKALSLPL